MAHHCLHIISRPVAMRLGLRRFFTGEPCKNGHIDERNTRNRTCMACANALQNEREKNKAALGIIKRFSTGIFSASDARLLGLVDCYTGKPCVRGHIAYRRASDGKCRECLKQKNRVRAENNRDYMNAAIRKWKKKNLIKIRSYGAKRRARRNESNSHYTENDVNRIMRLQKKKCANCMACCESEFHIDHIMPISLGGSNSADNIQILCPQCNLKKASKTPEDWAKENGRLI